MNQSFQVPSSRIRSVVAPIQFAYSIDEKVCAGLRQYARASGVKNAKVTLWRFKDTNLLGWKVVEGKTKIVENDVSEGIKVLIDSEGGKPSLTLTIVKDSQQRDTTSENDELELIRVQVVRIEGQRSLYITDFRPEPPESLQEDFRLKLEQAVEIPTFISPRTDNQRS